MSTALVKPGGRGGDKGTRGQGEIEIYISLSPCPLVPPLPSQHYLRLLPPRRSFLSSRSRSSPFLSSSSSSMARANALRTGAGICELAPRTDFQMISLNSMSGAASSLLKSSCADLCEPGAFCGFFSARSTRASRCLYGARSALFMKELYIGVAPASYWLIGGSPRISSIVRNIPEVVYIVEST